MPGIPSLVLGLWVLLAASAAVGGEQAYPLKNHTSLVPKELLGPSCRGYYLFATDRAPTPGEWKHLTQGMVRVGEIDVGFDILTNDGQEAVAREALEMIRHARLVSPR